MVGHYTCHITWSAEDGEHLGRCAEFPSLIWLAPTPGEALSGIRELVSGVLADMQASGESPPEPLANPHPLRTIRGVGTPGAHRALVIQATEEGASLNRLVSARLV